MALFQTKKIQSFILFIIVLVAVLWIFQDNFLKLLASQKVTEQLVSNAEVLKRLLILKK